MVAFVVFCLPCSRCKLFELPDDSTTQVWNAYGATAFEVLKDPQKTISGASLFPGQLLVIEKQTSEGRWPSSQSRQIMGGGASAVTSYGGSSGAERHGIMGSPLTSMAAPRPSTHIILACLVLFLLLVC